MWCVVCVVMVWCDVWWCGVWWCGVFVVLMTVWGDDVGDGKG